MTYGETYNYKTSIKNAYVLSFSVHFVVEFIDDDDDYGFEM